MTPKLSPAHLTCLEQIRIANGWHEQKLITSENEFSDNDGTEADNLSRGDAFENGDGGIITPMEEEDIAMVEELIKGCAEGMEAEPMSPS